MKTKNFLSGGKLGDFIHTLFVVKNICERECCKANLYLSGGGDIWSYGIDRAYKDLYPLVVSQGYINMFDMEANMGQGDFINLNSWREVVATEHAETGKYSRCWTDLLSEIYHLTPSSYAWLSPMYYDNSFKDAIVIHQSLKHYCELPWSEIFKLPCKGFIFLTSNNDEYTNFKHRGCATCLYTESVTLVTSIIASCKLYIGNQSALSAIASALDVPRIIGLDPDPAPFYMGEEKHSDNVMWYLSDGCKFLKI